MNITSNHTYKSDSIDNLAFSFFSLLTMCSLLSDSYIIINDFFKNTYIKKKINHIKNIGKVIFGLSFKKYKNDDDGNIIIEDKCYDEINNIDIKSSTFVNTNPFQYDTDSDSDSDNGEQSSKENTMNLSKRSVDKELFSGERSSIENTNPSKIKDNKKNIKINLKPMISKNNITMNLLETDKEILSKIIKDDNTINLSESSINTEQLSETLVEENTELLSETLVKENKELFSEERSSKENKELFSKERSSKENTIISSTELLEESNSNVKNIEDNIVHISNNILIEKKILSEIQTKENKSNKINKIKEKPYKVKDTIKKDKNMTKFIANKNIKI